MERPTVSCISAAAGGNAEQVLRLIATTINGSASSRESTLQPDGSWKCNVYDKVRQCFLPPVTLRLLGSGELQKICRDELFLRDVPFKSTWSCKPIDTGLWVLPIGAKLPTHRFLGVANAIVACWVIRGFGSTNVNGEVLPNPYGADAQINNSRKKRARRARNSSKFPLIWLK